MAKTAKKTTAIGVDIGGGSVKLGLVSSDGKLLARSSFLTPRKTKHHFLDVLCAHIRDLQATARQRGLAISGVGVGAPGAIDVERGFVYFFPNIDGWENTPLKQILQTHLRLPVFVDNDANAMALAESYFGAGKKAKSMIALTLGTGIGGGMVFEGKLFHGSHFSAAEMGHLIINENGPLCACGTRGCVEAYVGTSYFVREIEKRLKKNKKSILHKWLKQGKKLSPQLVGEAARAGDALSGQMWRDVGQKLGTALTGLINILNPDTIVIGGGIAENWPLLYKPLVRTLNKKAFPIAARSVKVVRAKMGQEAGLIGAAALAFTAKNK